MPWIARRASEHQVLTACAGHRAASSTSLFPFSNSAPTLMMLSFVLGLGLGASQPMVLSLLHTHAPPGRMGEAAGVRMSLVQSMAVAVPLAFGALGSDDRPHAGVLVGGRSCLADRRSPAPASGD